jgi:hypothetical protein
MQSVLKYGLGTAVCKNKKITEIECFAKVFCNTVRDGLTTVHCTGVHQDLRWYDCTPVQYWITIVQRLLYILPECSSTIHVVQYRYKLTLTKYRYPAAF